MFYFIKLGKKLEFENKREKIFFNVLLYIKLGKRLEFENKRKFFEFLMFHFIKLGKKLEFENKRFFFFLNFNVLLYKVRKKVNI